MQKDNIYKEEQIKRAKREAVYKVGESILNACGLVISEYPDGRLKEITGGVHVITEEQYERIGHLLSGTRKKMDVKKIFDEEIKDLNLE